MKLNKTFLLTTIFIAFLSINGCASAPKDDVSAKNITTTNEVSETKNKQIKSSYQGEGLVIVVPPPKLTSSQNTDKWISQFLQDSITTNLARYSKMTVIDRVNEDLIIAEQELSETGYYDEENAVELGKMTNAQLVCIGTIQKTASKYSVNFRVNNIETNEIKAAFSESYSLAQIEGGEAVQEISKEILLGLGIELDDKTITALSKSDDKSITSTKSLAKGYAAQENGDEIEALYQFMLVGESGAAGTEALRNTQVILNGTISGTSVKEKYAERKLLAEKWNTIFDQLGKWLERNLPIFVYDFSMVADGIANDKKSIELTIMPGIKCVPNRNAIILYKRVREQWEEIKANPENSEWVELVTISDKLPYINSVLVFNYYTCKVGLFSPIGEKFAEKSVTKGLGISFPYRAKDLNIIPSQKEYFDKNHFQEIKIKVNPEYMPDEFSPMIFSIERKTDYRYKEKKSQNYTLTEKDFLVLTVEEYNAFVAENIR